MAIFFWQDKMVMVAMRETYVCISPSEVMGRVAWRVVEIRVGTVQVTRKGYRGSILSASPCSLQEKEKSKLLLSSIGKVQITS
jgi:hypothetical protein